MKNYKHILEAINRGIQLALDDYEEQQNEPIAPKRETIKNNNSTKKLIWFYDKFVDLNLPSGTLWAKYNLGVDPKKLSIKELWYGDYYAWGEIEPKPEYNEETYKFSEKEPKYEFSKNGEKAVTYSDEYKYTKYCDSEIDGYNGYTDDKVKLDPCDDVVNVKIKNGCTMPSASDIEELIQNTTQKYIENYENVEGLNGLLFTSKQDISKFIFIPCAGEKCAKTSWNSFGENMIGYEIHLWANEYEPGWTGRALSLVFLNFWKSKKGTPDDPICKVSKEEHKFLGCSVRAILKNK